MVIKIVTDSSADLPAELAEELGIAVVPLFARFGEKVYREQVDISLDEFYHKEKIYSHPDSKHYALHPIVLLLHDCQ